VNTGLAYLDGGNKQKMAFKAHSIRQYRWYWLVEIINSIKYYLSKSEFADLENFMGNVGYKKI